MRYFVTGGAGFIGSHLVDRLMTGKNKVTVYDHLSTGRREHLKKHFGSPRFCFLKKDLRDLKSLTSSMAGHDFVFHLAANSDIMAAMLRPALDFEQGIVMTFQVLEAMRVNQVKQMVYTSGSGVYGDRGFTVLKEDRGNLHPISMYGAAKLSSEAMISAYSFLYDIQAWIFRPANIIGSRPTHGVIDDLIHKLKKDPKKLTVLGDGTQSKSYIHIDDVLNGIFFALKRRRDPVNIFNIASESALEVKGIVRIILEEMKLNRTAVSYGKKSRGWKGDVPKVRLATGKLKRLGWRPKLNSEQAVRKTVREILEISASSKTL